MGNITSISVLLQNSRKNNCLSDGKIKVGLTLNSTYSGPDWDGLFKCYVYAEGFYPMCKSNGEAPLHTNGKVCEFGLQSSHIWLPGQYTIYVRETRNDVLTAAGLTIDEGMKTSIGPLRECAPCSCEDILTSCLEEDSNYWHEVACVAGAAPLRRRMIERTQLEVYNEFRRSLSGNGICLEKNMIISTPCRNFPEETLQSFCKAVMPDQTFCYVDCSTLFDPTCINPYEPLDSVGFSSWTAYCLTNIQALLGTGGKVIARRFLKHMSKYGQNCALLLCGTKQEIAAVLDIFPSLKELFPRQNRLECLSYSPFEMVQAFHEAVVQSGIGLTGEMKHSLASAVLQGSRNGTLASWTISDIHRFVADEVCPHYLQRALGLLNTESLPELAPEDICLSKLTQGGETVEDNIRNLNAMTGLDEVKRSISTLANRTRFYAQRRRLGLHTSDRMVFHAVFTGNPGTGKTTVARLMGRIYHNLGILSKGEVIAVDRTRIVGRYIGETEENMKNLLEEARGNVLFIDEAYTLCDGAADRKDFGARAIECLLTVLAQPDPDMVVILAGYEKEMDAMLNSNPGLAGRFPNKFRFADYNAGQLMEIAAKLLQRDDYELTPEAGRVLQATIEQTLAQRTQNFGNARWMEQYILNGIVPAMADRLAGLPDAKEQDYRLIEAGDILQAFEKFNPKTIELRPRRQVGFCA